MKLRAPRCNDATLSRSMSAGSICEPPPPAAKPCGAAKHAPSAIKLANFLNLVMVDHPVWHRLRLVHGRVKRHEQEEGKIQYGENARQRYVNTFSRRQAKEQQGEERNHERGQCCLVHPAAVTDGPHSTSIEPRQEQR